MKSSVCTLRAERRFERCECVDSPRLQPAWAGAWSPDGVCRGSTCPTWLLGVVAPGAEVCASPCECAPRLLTVLRRSIDGSGWESCIVDGLPQSSERFAISSVWMAYCETLSLRDVELSRAPLVLLALAESALAHLFLYTRVTWLILPVVICLSQRLSHACLSTRPCTAKPRMAH